MDAEKLILVSSEVNGIITLTLNRPEKRNALNSALIREFIAILDEIAEHPTLQVLMITGNGEHFCAGADMLEMQGIMKLTYEDNRNDAALLATLLQKLYLFPKPTLALLQGATFGGGLGLAACCDLVIATEDSQFGFSEVKRGLTPSMISPYIIAAIGERAARYYFLTGQLFNAETAHHIGLIHQIVAAEALWSAGMTLAHEITLNSQQALQEAKKLIREVTNQMYGQPLIDFTIDHFAKMRISKDAQEGLLAFLTKRLPRWH